MQSFAQVRGKFGVAVEPAGQHHGQLRAGPVYVLGQFDTAHDGHRHIAQHCRNIVLATVDDRHRFFAMLGLDDTKTRPLESVTHHATNDGLVVDDEHQPFSTGVHLLSLSLPCTLDKIAARVMFVLRLLTLVAAPACRPLSTLGP